VLQGQTFLQAAGDQGSNSWAGDPGDIRDLDGVTVVGGTALTLTGSPPAYGSETVWNIAGQGAGGGGIATSTPIPLFQTGINMSTNGGSTVNRNLPDVAAVASNPGIIYTNPTTGVQAPTGVIGTSLAAPIWAGLIALANQQSASSPTGSGRVGDPNPFLYTVIANNASAYAASFNTLSSTTGNNSGACPGQTGTNSSVCNVVTGTSPSGKPIFSNTWTPAGGNYTAVKGYNLATGLGSPKCALLNELANGATTATAPTTSTATITYHQTGACNGYATNSGITSAGANQAYVAFGIEQLDNSGGTAPFAFDPSKLYVQQTIDNVFQPGATTAIAGPFAAQAATVPAEQVVSYSVSPQAVIIVQTANANGAQEASATPYALKYQAAATDPTVLLTKSDASQTSWPYTPDCATLSGILH
jgi:subtilase family serine protease